MGEFRHRSVRADGKTVEGVVTASDENSLASLLQDQGLTLIEAEPLGASPAKTKKGAKSDEDELPKDMGTVKRAELIRFTYNLHAIISAGVPIVKGLESLYAEAESAESPMTPVLQGLIRKVKQGEPFSTALAAYPKVFPALYINLIRAGESSGHLETILIDLGENLEWQEEITSTLKQATVYPSIVISAVFGLIALIVYFVIPQFTEIFKKMQIELPLPTRIMVWVGDFAASDGHWVFLGVALAIVGLVIWKRSKQGAYWIERSKVKVPLFGAVIMKIGLARFAKNLAILNSAGVTITESLEICQKIAGNPVLEHAVGDVRERVMRGENLSRAMAANPVFPILVRNMVAVGEESGKLGESLMRTAQFYDREVKMSLKRAFAILEPAITIFLAVIVGGIAVAILSTLYKAITTLGK